MFPSLWVVIADYQSTTRSRGFLQISDTLTGKGASTTAI
jgi:hypothetical protein